MEPEEKREEIQGDGAYFNKAVERSKIFCMDFYGRGKNRIMVWEKKLGEWETDIRLLESYEAIDEERADKCKLSIALIRRNGPSALNLAQRKPIYLSYINFKYFYKTKTHNLLVDNAVKFHPPKSVISTPKDDLAVVKPTHVMVTSSNKAKEELCSKIADYLRDGVSNPLIAKNLGMELRKIKSLVSEVQTAFKKRGIIFPSRRGKVSPRGYRIPTVDWDSVVSEFKARKRETN